jgi:hypothetical protein
MNFRKVVWKTELFTLLCVAFYKITWIDESDKETSNVDNEKEASNRVQDAETEKETQKKEI